MNSHVACDAPNAARRHARLIGLCAIRKDKHAAFGGNMDAMIGTIVGGVLAILGGILAKSFDEWRQRQSLRAAFRAEVSAIVEMFEVRGHDKLFKDLLEHWKRASTAKPIMLGSLSKPIDPVFSKNSDKIGLLGRSVAGDLVRFYAVVDAIREDINSSANGEMDGLSQDAKIRMTEDDLRLLGEASEIAARLRATL
jgi:hypothetical protein